MFGGSFNGRSINDAEKDKLRDCHSRISLRWPWHRLICQTKGHIYRHLCLDATWHRFWVSLMEKIMYRLTRPLSEILLKSTLHTHTHALVERKSRQITATETYHWIRERWAKQMGSKRFNYINVPITGDIKQTDLFSPQTTTDMIHSTLEHNHTPSCTLIWFTFHVILTLKELSDW